MRRFFRRHRKENKENNGQSSPSHSRTAGPVRSNEAPFVPQVTPPGWHVCTYACAGLAGMPPEYHESIIAEMTQKLGAVPDNIRIDSLSMGNARLVPGQSRDIVSETHERRDIEGNTELAHIPLDLPTTHRYQPLPTGHARFLRLGGLGAHPLAYLESHPLSNPPPYIAVSYCWDPTSARRGMFLDRQSFSISETVLEVLNQVQASQNATGSRELLWIDQICINQADGAEKLDQMYRMGEIYSKATKVFIWLGPTANGSDAALEKMPQMLREVVALNQATETREDVPEDVPALINTDHGQLYGHLFMRPWFKRLWTVQEALLARELVVMCGYREVDFGLLVELASQILTYGSLDLIQLPGASEDEMTDAIIGVVNLSALRLGDAPVEQIMQGLSMGAFRSLVAEARTRQVTMAPDRVHAIMGVAPRHIRERMANLQVSQPSHNMWHLYAQFAKTMLENDPEWYFLSSAPSKDRPDGLPSWVPNFNSPAPFASELATPGRFSAGITPATRHLVQRTITEDELTAHGCRIDTITEIIPQTAFTEATQNTKHNDVYGDAAREWEQNCMRLCQKIFGLGPEQFPRLHVNILLAAPRTTSLQQQFAPSEPAPMPMRGRALDAYHTFWMGCRLRGEALRQIQSGDAPLPERFQGLPDGAERFADQALRMWRKQLPLEEYALLLEFTSGMKNMCSGRPYIATSTGLLGLGCPGVKEGDVVCVFYGSTVPYVLRQRRDGTMEFVGDAYVYGAMNGEALTGAERGPDEIFRIR
ncbi:heterokaryon incompatibility protein-domain-containing protein [Chaetomium sp. MPI-SDFR-AT-0129]|nr:heterokaryon incompatibility protein-domain-containing protein [Chaetomium sp. MPI-SDFR-AT-0129]